MAREVILVHNVNLLFDREFYHLLLFLKLKSWDPFVSDEAFLLELYSKHQLPRSHLTFKYRLSRFISDCNFGILAFLCAWSPPYKVALQEGHMWSITTTGEKERASWKGFKQGSWYSIERRCQQYHQVGAQGEEEDDQVTRSLTAKWNAICHNCFS